MKTIANDFLYQISIMAAMLITLLSVITLKSFASIEFVCLLVRIGTLIAIFEIYTKKWFVSLNVILIFIIKKQR